MNPITIALFMACVIGSSLALDCSAKMKDFHTCVASSHKKNEDDGKAKFEAIKVKIDACYTDNGCTSPAKPQKGGSSGASSGEKKHGNNTEGRECWKALGQAMKQDMETCVTKAVPDFTFPQKDGQKEGGEHGKHFGGHKGGFNHKDDNKVLVGCAKAQAVRDCKRALFNSSKPSSDEMKVRFQAGCDAKKTCLTALGVDCQTQMEQVKKAMCTCRQAQHGQAETLRASVPACKDIQAKPHKEGSGSGKGPAKAKSCDDEKDYCKLGFDVLAADLKAKMGAHL